MPPVTAAGSHDVEGPILRVDKITKRYGGLTAVSTLSFDVAPGCITSLIGPNGAGKTTAFNIISGLIRPDSGGVVLAGRDTVGWAPNRIIAAGLGRTFQDARLFGNLTAVENVMAGRICRTHSGLIDSIFWLPRYRTERREMLDRAMYLLDRMGIAEHRFKLPRELSYGLQRRLEIARALATEPRLLILDEPTAGVHGQAVRDMMSVIQELVGTGLTVLLVEHNMNVVMALSRTIVVMNFGQKIVEGPPNEVRNDPRVIEAYLGADA